MSARAIVVVCLTVSCLIVPFSALGDEQPAVWKGKAKVGFVRTTGNTETQTLAGDVEASYEPNPSRFYGKASALYAEQDDEESSNRLFLGFRYEHDLTQRLFAWAAAGYLKDKFAGYDSQISVGPGVGYFFVKEEHMTLKGLAGALYTMDNYTDGTDDSYVASYASGDFKWNITETVTFGQFLGFRVSMSELDSYFLDSETSLEVKMSDNISLGVGYVVNYQSEPPEGADKTDTRFITSLVVGF